MNKTLIDATAWLTDLGITVESRRTCLAVNRNDVAKLLGGNDSENSVALIVEIKKGVSNKLFWGGVGYNPDWLFLESF